MSDSVQVTKVIISLGLINLAFMDHTAHKSHSSNHKLYIHKATLMIIPYQSMIEKTNHINFFLRVEYGSLVVEFHNTYCFPYTGILVRIVSPLINNMWQYHTKGIVYGMYEILLCCLGL